MVKVFGKRSSTSVSTEECVREMVQAVLYLLQKHGPLTNSQKKYCDERCVARFLRARGNHVKKAARQLRASLAWRLSLDVDYLTADEFAQELTVGTAFVAGQDQENRPVLIVRMKPENLAIQYQRQFLRFLVFTMEVAITDMPFNVEQCVLILDAGCLKKGSPCLTVIVQLLKMLGDQYPERVAKVFVVDPPSTLYYFWKAMGLFLDHGMKEKLRFSFSRKYDAAMPTTSHPMRVGRSDPSRNFSAGQSDADEDKSMFNSKKAASNTPSPMPERDFRFFRSPGASLLAADKKQARSFSFASPVRPRSWAYEAGILEFRSFRVDARSAHGKEGKPISLPDRTRRERSWGGFSSQSQGLRREEPQAGRMQKDRNDDPFKPYISFYRSSYNEAAYRALMKPPRGGLVSIVSPELQRQPSVGFEGRRV